MLNCPLVALTALIVQQNQDVEVRMGMQLTAPITTHGNEGDIVSLLPDQKIPCYGECLNYQPDAASDQHLNGRQE